MKTKNQELLEEINEAFARSDTDFIADHLTDTIRWEIVGDRTIEGKKAFIKALKEMEVDEPMELTTHHIITHGKEAAVNGEMKRADGEAYAFCDVYKFSGFKNPEITEMTSYVVGIQQV